MVLPLSQPVKTATNHTSIWRDVALVTFRSNIAELKGLTDIPAAKATHIRSLTSDTAAMDARFTLPFETERRLSDDFALIASLKNDGYDVSAAAVEEAPDGEAITVRLASNCRISGAAKALINAVSVALQDSAHGSG